MTPEAQQLVHKVLILNLPLSVLQKYEEQGVVDVKRAIREDLFAGLAKANTQQETLQEARTTNTLMPITAVRSKLIALTLDPTVFDQLGKLAKQDFLDDKKTAAAYFVALGAGLNYEKPTGAQPVRAKIMYTDLREKQKAEAYRQEAIERASIGQQKTSSTRPNNFSRTALTQEQRAAATASAPSWQELRAKKEAIGISQRSLGIEAGLSRGIVSEALRLHGKCSPETRILIAETLSSLEKSKTG